MKSLLSVALLLTASLPGTAAIVYSGSQNLTVDWDDLEGISINMATGEIANGFPVEYDAGAWINFSLGGNGIFNGELIHPMAGGVGAYDAETDHYLNLAPGTTVDVSGHFPSDGYASVNHPTNTAVAGKFLFEQSGFIGFEFQTVEGGDSYYGWLRLTVTNQETTGVIADWAYESTAGTGIQVGAVPEPAATAMLLSGFGALALGRRRI